MAKKSLWERTVELTIAVGEREPEALGKQAPDGGLAGAHEADQDDHGSACSATRPAMACRASW